MRELLRHPVAGIDLNLGCPAPKIYRKNVGGGLLRDPARIDELLAALRAAVPGLFTVKMRIGFDGTEHFDRLLDLVNEHRVDLLTVHGRTVKEMYRAEVHYDFIAHAVARARCPVLANGSVSTPENAAAVLRITGAAGLMIGRDGTPKVLEFNCRLGDPETQPIMARLESDLVEALDKAVDGRLDEVDLKWDRRIALGVVLAAANYPDSPRTGDVITGIPKESDHQITFHAGTKLDQGQLRTSGGRVLCVVGLADTVKAAQQKAYSTVEQIHFDGMQYRKDIGFRAIK